MSASEQLLCAEHLFAGYLKRDVLEDVNFAVARNEIVVLLGHNGAGKSTLLKALFGIIPIRRGKVHCVGKEVVAPGPRVMLGHGVVFLPQGKGVFRELSVIENLELTAIGMGIKRISKDRLCQAIGEYTWLQGRQNERAGNLSGGELQMISLLRVALARTRVLLMDEPLAGLSGRAATEALKHVVRVTRESAMGTVIVEQRVAEVLTIADRVCVMRNGRITFSGPPQELIADPERLRTEII